MGHSSLRIRRLGVRIPSGAPPLSWQDAPLGPWPWRPAGSPSAGSPPRSAATGWTGADYTTRQGAYDQRKLRGKRLIAKPGRSRRYQVPGDAARTIAALLALREEIIDPILAGVRSPRRGRKPATWTAVDRDYEALRIDMQTLFRDLRINTGSAAA